MLQVIYRRASPARPTRLDARLCDLLDPVDARAAKAIPA